MRFLKSIYKKILREFRIIKAFWYDYRSFTKIHAVSNHRDELLGNMMLTIHAIEKGLSFTKNKRVFGGDKASWLCDMLNEYISMYGIDEFSKIGLSVLSEYITNDYSTQDVLIKNKIKETLSANKLFVEEKLAGTKEITKPIDFNIAEIENFYRTRSSVRDFSEKVLSDEDIKSALNIAKYTPSACNRQATRVHVVRNREIMKQILENQLGDQGWCMNASTMFVVTTNRTYFANVYEREQGYIDGGLFAMNLVMGLHANQIATCFKMYIRDPKIDREFRYITNIPDYESPVVLILAGYYKDYTILSPQSVKLDVKADTI